MLRPLAALCAALLLAHALVAQNLPTLADIVREANRLQADGQPRAAAELLEKNLSRADGDRDFTASLRAAYTAQLKDSNDPAIQSKLNLLREPAAAPAKSAANNDWIKQATTAFNKATTEPTQYLNARDLFSLAFRNKVELTGDQTAAWAYCRLKVAADKLNKSTDPTAAAECAAEIEAALNSVPKHAALQDAGGEVLALARKRAGLRTAPKTEVASDGSSFRIVGLDGAAGEQLRRTAEAKRADIFTRWSGPPGGAWGIPCEIVIHADGAAFAKATGLPPVATGRADVKLRDGAPLARRIDLRADDSSMLDNALPRELTTIVLADLFASQAPPKWAELGMAVLATSESEIGRYLRTVPRCDRAGELPSVESVLKATDIPDAGVTGFHVESVSLVEFLVRSHGEKTFTAFVRDGQRYGTDAALLRQYGWKDARQLEAAWRASALQAKK